MIYAIASFDSFICVKTGFIRIERLFFLSNNINTKQNLKITEIKVKMFILKKTSYFVNEVKYKINNNTKVNVSIRTDFNKIQYRLNLSQGDALVDIKYTTLIIIDQ